MIFSYLTALMKPLMKGLITPPTMKIMMDQAVALGNSANAVISRAKNTIQPSKVTAIPTPAGVASRFILLS